MVLIRRAKAGARRLGILAGGFNPPTRAHVALADAALPRVDEVLFVVPRAFPHKDFHGATLEQRLEMLQRLASPEPRFSLGIAEGGLFVEIAREAREHYGEAELLFLCGRDAAERIVGWDYGEPSAFSAMLQEFGLLVAQRGGGYVPPFEFASRIETLDVEGLDEISSTEVRERVALGKEWRGLVPEAIVGMVEKVYSGR